MSTISSLDLRTASLEVTWDDGVVTLYPWIWLRDHAHDAETLHPITQQRQLFTAALASDLAATAVTIAGPDLKIEWNDGGSAALLPIAFLAKYRVAGAARAAVDTVITL